MLYVHAYPSTVDLSRHAKGGTAHYIDLSTFGVIIFIALHLERIEISTYLFASGHHSTLSHYGLSSTKSAQLEMSASRFVP